MLYIYIMSERECRCVCVCVHVCVCVCVCMCVPSVMVKCSALPLTGGWGIVDIRILCMVISLAFC